MTTIFSPFRELELATRPRLAPIAAPSAVPFDAFRTEDALELRFDLPGYAPEDVDLSVERNLLTLTASRTRSVPEGASTVVAERRHGAVRRQLRLSDSLDLSDVQARFDNGVLSVRIPVAATAQPHRVQIAVGGTPEVEAAPIVESAPIVEAAVLDADAAEDASPN
jgi:HSP20 family protein